MKTLLIFLLPAFLFVNCSKSDRDKDCVETVSNYVDEVVGPSSTTVGVETELTVTFTVSNGCGDFHEFKETASGNNRNIEVMARYTGCDCTTALKQIDTVYKFTADTPGEYRLIFKKFADQVIIHTLTVLPQSGTF